MAQEVKTYISSTCICSVLGHDSDSNWQAAKSGKSGLHSEPNPFMPDGQKACYQRIADVAASATRSRLEQMMIECARNVLDKETPADQRLGIVISTTKGNISHLGTELPQTNSDVYLTQLAQHVGSSLGIEATPIVISNACISGVAAAVVAQRLIMAGDYDSVLLIGGDELTDFIASGFSAFKSLSPQGCRPYDVSHDGLSLGEAAAALYITKQPKASDAIVLNAGAMSNDANHISGPSRTGEPLAVAIKQAMEQAHIKPSEVGLVNAHGTGTVYNDDMESKAIGIAGLGSTPTNSLKPYFGHTLGASGIVEIAMCAEQMRHSQILPTLGFKELGTPVEITVCSALTDQHIDHCVKTASGFGGTNAAVVLSQAGKAQPQQKLALKPATICSEVSIEHGKITLNGTEVFSSEKDFGGFIRDAYHDMAQPNMKFFKMDNLCKLGYIAAEVLLRDTDVADTNRTAVVMANHGASIDTDVEHCRILAQGQPASPATFVYTLANIVMSEVCIRHHIQGETTFFVQEEYDRTFLEHYAQILLSTGLYDAVVTGWCEYTEQEYKTELFILK